MFRMETGMDYTEYYDEDEIDIRDVIRKLRRQKVWIIAITILTTLIAGVYAYYQPSLYQASTTIEIGEAQKGGMRTDDLLQAALSGGSASGGIETEIAVMQSRFLVEQAVKKVHLSTRIEGINALHKSVELWHDAPFEVHLERGKEIRFDLEVHKDETFTLEAEGNNPLTGQTIHYSGNHRFGQPIKHKAFELTLVRTQQPLRYAHFRFVVHNPAYHAEAIRNTHLTVNQIGKKANVVKLTYRDPVPARARDCVNALADAYMAQNIRRKTIEAEQTLKFVNKQLAIIEQGLKRSASRLETFKKKNKTVDVTLSATELSKSLLDYESQLGILGMQVDILKTLSRKIARGKHLETLTLAGADIESPNLSRLIGELQQATLTQKELSKTYTSAHPKVQANTARIRQLKTVIRSSLNNILHGLKEKEALLKKNMVKYQEKLARLPKIQRDYLSLERTFLFNEKFYSYLMEKRTETEIRRAATVSQNRIIDRALLPKQPIKPKRKLIVVVGLILGLILGVVFALVREFLDNTIKTQDEIERETQAPIIGTIPHYSIGKEKRTLMVRERPKSAVSEAFRHLRTNLQFMLPEGQAHIIAVTSTIAQEGKTSIASNLAAILNLLDKKVIILNFDLRKPMLHTLFGVPNNKGLSAYLSGHADEQEIVVATPYSNLDIIPSGPTPPNPSELIASPRSRVLLDHLRQHYDVIILDTPPIGLVTDARTLLTYADAVVYTLRADYSKKEFLKSIQHLYEQKDIHSLGLVLNDLKIEKHGYGYGYGYYEDR